MTSQRVAGQIPLNIALRLYWKNLVPLTFYPAALAVALKLVPERWAAGVFLLTAPVFFGCSYYAIIPWLKENVTYSYNLVMGCCWLLISPILLVLAILALKHFLNVK
jgi:hypothetical protein